MKWPPLLPSLRRRRWSSVFFPTRSSLSAPFSRRPQILSWEGKREKRKVDSHFTAGEEGREVYCVYWYNSGRLFSTSLLIL